MEPTLSSPSVERLLCWRLFFESALALGDVLDTELEQAVGYHSAGTTSSSISRSPLTASA